MIEDKLLRLREHTRNENHPISSIFHPTRDKDRSESYKCQILLEDLGQISRLMIDGILMGRTDAAAAAAGRGRTDDAAKLEETLSSVVNR